MRSIKLIVCSLVVAISAFATTGAGAQVLKNEELLEKSGFVETVNKMPTSILQGFSGVLAASPSTDKRLMGLFNRTVPIAYKPEKILDTVDDALNEELTEAERSTLVAFYSSETSGRLYEAHKAALKVLTTNPLKMLNYSQKATISPGRAGLYREIIEASESLEDAVSTLRIVNVAIPAAVMGALKQPVDPEAMQARYMRDQQQLLPILQQQLYSAHAYMLRNVSDEDLEIYLTYLKSPAGKRFQSLIRKLLAEALMIQTDEFAKMLVKELGIAPQ